MVRVIHCGGDHSHIIGEETEILRLEQHKQTWKKLRLMTLSLSVSKLSKVSAGRGTNEYFGCVRGSLQSSRREEGPLTVHGLQSDQTRDEVVEVDGHVGLGVAQDDQLEQVVVQLEACGRERWEGLPSRHVSLRRETDPTCRFQGHPHFVGAHGTRFVQVKGPEYCLNTNLKTQINAHC